MRGSNASSGDQSDWQVPSSRRQWTACPSPTTYHQAIIADLDNDGVDEIYRAVGGGLGRLVCDGPSLEDCTKPGASSPDGVTEVSPSGVTEVEGDNSTMNALYRWENVDSN